MKEPILEFVTLRSEEARNAGMNFYLENTTDVEVDKKLERELLNKFQKNVMDTYVESIAEVIAESPHVGDDFLDDEDPDVVMVWRMLKECAPFLKCDEVISIIPLDFIGNLGFVVSTHPIQFNRG
jgi:hypothetical protein